MTESDLRELINELKLEILAEAAENKISSKDPREEENARNAIDNRGEYHSMSFHDWLNTVLESSTTMNTFEEISDSSVFGEPYSAWHLNVCPKEFALSIDEAGVWSDDRDHHAGFYRESKEFTFDKFILDINEREEKERFRRNSFDENNNDESKRLLQRLYQENWRNSTKPKGK